MAIMTAAAAKTNLYSLIDGAREFHEPIIEARREPLEKSEFGKIIKILP